MRRILIVDDDRVILHILADGLRELGYTVSTSVCGAEALKLARESAYDLVVLDMRMPEMTGLEVAEELKKDNLAAFVFLSAFGDESVVRDAAEAGALGYLVKPVDIPQLVPFIEAAMARGREIDLLRSTTEQLEQALKVEQKTRTAVGIIMERKGLDRQEAFDLLRARARSQRRKIGEVADELITAVEGMNLTLRLP
jgi:AmiR/NasT family two-component response regulator